MKRFQLIAALGLGAPSLLPAVDVYTWTGSANSNWHISSNWNTTLVPDSIEEGAILDSTGPVNIGGDTFIFSLELNNTGGIIINADNLFTTTSLDWDNGSITGPGTIRVITASSIDVGTGALINGATFVNDGQITLTNSLTLNGGAVFNNNNTFIPSDGTTFGTTGGAGEAIGVINNTGFIRKETGPATATVASFIHNDNEISSLSGTLSIPQGGTASGQFRTGENGIVNINGTFDLSNGASIFGDGQTTLGGSGVLNVATGATVTFDNFTIAGGTVAGMGTAQYLGNDLFWNGGSVSGNTTSVISDLSSVSVTATSGAPFSITDNHEVFISPGGELLFPNSDSTLRSNGNGRITNFGTLTFADDGDITQNGTTSTTLLNLVNEVGGTVVKTHGVGTGNPTLLVAQINSAGTWRIQDGEMRLFRDANFSGPIIIGPGATLRIEGSNTYTLNDNASISGGGTFEHRGGTLDVPSGSRILIDGYANSASGGPVTGGGTLVFNTSESFTEMRHSGPGTTEIPPGVTISGIKNFDLDEGRNLLVLGELEVTESFNVTSTNGATIDNQGTTRFLQSSRITHGGGTFAINNPGHLVFAAPAFANISFPVDQYSGEGLISIDSGRVNFTQPNFTLTGTLEMAAGTQFNSPQINTAPGSVVRGVGKLTGVTSFGGSIQPGLSIGTMEISGNTTFEPGSSYACELGNGSSDLLDISNGSLDITNGQLRLTLDAGFTPTAGDSWTIASANSITGNFSIITQPTVAPGFGFFLSKTAQDVIITYSAIDSFQKAYESATGQSLGPNPDLTAAAQGDLDGDGLTNLIDYALGGNLTQPDPLRVLALLSVTQTSPSTLSFRYPLSNAPGVTLTLESAIDPSGAFTTHTMTPAGTVVDGGITFQLVSVEIPSFAPKRFFRLNATL